MALKQSPFRFFWSRLHFVVRLAGLTGLVAAGVGLALYLLDHGTAREALQALGRQCWEALQGLSHWDFGGAFEVAVWLVLGGALAAALALVVETLVMLRFAAGRRSVFGANALVQMAVALVLLVGVNVFSAYHYLRFDWTHDQQFTLAAHLSAPLLDQLERLKDSEPTTIIVYQRNKAFSQLSDKPDVYDYAASPRVVEKVRDLVDEFREMGGKFRVQVLDVEEEGFKKKLTALTVNARELNGAADLMLKRLDRLAEELVKDGVEWSDFAAFAPALKEAAEWGKANQTLDQAELDLIEQAQKNIGEAAHRKVTEEELKKITGLVRRHADQLSAFLSRDEIEWPALKTFEAALKKAIELAEAKKVFEPSDFTAVKQALKNLDDLTRLREAIDQAPGNSIFFYVAGTTAERPSRVQRLGFHDVFQLDKVGSEEAGNLVLLNQGVDTFARKVLNIEEKRPRIALGVVHEALGTEGSGDLGMAGLKRTLTERGFDVRDVILKNWPEFKPAVLTYDESKFDRLEAELADLDQGIKIYEEALRRPAETLKDLQTMSLDELSKKYLGGRKATEEIRTINIKKFKDAVESLNFVLTQLRTRREEAAAEKAHLPKENLDEQRRISDLKAKTERLLADCDLLILPRMTIFDATRMPPEAGLIPPQVHELDKAQVEAFKEFLKAGKPILACLGPINEPSRPGMPPRAPAPDDLEKMLTDLGFQLPPQTILFNVESKAFAQRRGNLVVLGADVEVPSVHFDLEADKGYPKSMAGSGQADLGKLNPIYESLQLTARSLGKNQKLELRVRCPRPVYYDAGRARRALLAFGACTVGAAGSPLGDGLFMTTAGLLPGVAPRVFPYQATFMMTDPASWNETQPFPTLNEAQPFAGPQQTPHYEPPKETDAANGTVGEKRPGPFPIAAAVETKLPPSWYEDQNVPPATARVAVIGQGGVFMGAKLTPVREKLLTDTCNWLLGRDDLLTRKEVLVRERDGSERPDENTWQYPRVELSPRNKALWQWGIWLGLPALFAYLGLVVFMVRRLR